MADERLTHGKRLQRQPVDKTGFAAANANESPASVKLTRILQRTASFAPDAAKSPLLNWLMKVSHTNLDLDPLQDNHKLVWHVAEKPDEQEHDWSIVTSLSGHTRDEFASAATPLPLSASEIAHFRRNHRNADLGLARHFRQADVELPESIQSLFLLYQERAHADVEATLFIAQASGSTRVARVMADLQAIGAFANGHHIVHHMAVSYAVSVAFDTSALIDAANHEAANRLVLPVNHGAHLLKYAPEDIAALAAAIVEHHMLSADEFMEKARLLAEARQDVNRFAPALRFRTAVMEGDLPPHKTWVRRIGYGYSRLFASWVADLPELGLDIPTRRISA